MEIKRLKKENYDELISLLNLVFTKQNGCVMDFERELPNMCVRDDLHMRKHVGLFEDGKLVSVVGVYPLPTKVLECKINFCTVGNVATHPDYEGRGYMNLFLFYNFHCTFKQKVHIPTPLVVGVCCYVSNGAKINFAL